MGHQLARCSPRAAPSCVIPRASVPACLCARPHRAPASILLAAAGLEQHHKPFSASKAALERSPLSARQPMLHMVFTSAPWCSKNAVIKGRVQE